MRKALRIVAVITMVGVSGGAGQSAADSAGIRQAALDYVEGYYEGSVERMDRALHPDFAKRSVMNHPQTNRSLVRPLTRSMMVEMTRAGGGSDTPAEERGIEVHILDVYNNIASVKTVARDFIDYLHIAKWNGEWKILNVLWDANVMEVPTTAEERARYVGTYLLGETEVRVLEEDDHLAVEAEGQGSMALRYQGDHTFVEAFAGGVRLTFEMQDNRAIGFVFQQGGQALRAARVP
jgi:hypothetical protein